MANSCWQGELAGLESTTCPDLTGKSSSVRKNLLDIRSVEQALRVSDDAYHEVSLSICLAVCARVLALYSGERDLCIAYLPSSQNLGTHTNGPLPMRVVIEETTSNQDVFSNIEDVLQKVDQYGPPSSSILEKVFETSDARPSDVLVMIEDDSSSSPSFPLEQYEKYNLIIRFVRSAVQATQTAYELKMHYRSSILNTSDTPHVLAILQEALDLILEEPKLNFLSWKSDSRLTRSVLNSDFKAAETYERLTVHAAFEKHATERPDDIALDFLQGDSTRTKWTFSTLNSLANRIANQLINKYDVQIEEPVPICVAKSPAFYACILGVLKAGAVFTPFAGSPPERKRFMLQELGARVILIMEGQDTSWTSPAQIFDVTPLLEANAQSTTPKSVKLAAHVLPSNLCYQMYTSGSTGRPKAVSLEHKNAVQTACVTRDLIPWTSESRILQQAGVTFDMCYFETFFAWNVGICLCSAPDESIYNRLTDVINEMKVTLLGLTPSVALTLEPEQVPNVKWMYCIGEALPQPLVDMWEGRLVNSYGPTEAAQMVTLFPVNKEVKSTVIGKPFQNTSFTILRKDSTEIVPILGVGELCIGGYQVAREYYKNPEKTKQSFIRLGSQRLYRTGDLVRMLGNDTIEFIGRIDDQVKVRGQRVELGEIDKVLEGSHSAIERASTQILKVSDQAKSQLVAFLVLESTANNAENFDQHAIRQAVDSYLADNLPAHMIPRLMLFIEKIPLSLAGKIDKRALTRLLRESEQVRGSPRPSKIQSSKDIIHMLQEIYGEFCGILPHEIGLHVSIYQLGIDSISAIQISHKLRANGFRIQASDVMNYPTISQLSQLMSKDADMSKQAELHNTPTFNFEKFDEDYRHELAKRHNISKTKIASIRPASPLQSSMVVQSSQSTGLLYFNHLCYRLPKGMVLERFLEAWEALISNHEILRSGFAPIDHVDYPVAMVTYHARSLLSPVRQHPDDDFDLGRWRLQFIESATQNMHQPPWQVLVSSKLDKFYLSAHHALYDAQVLEILIRNLALAYDGLRLPVYHNIEPRLAEILEKAHQNKTRIQFWQEHGKRAIASKFPLLNPLLEESGKLQIASAPSSHSLSELEQGCRKSGITMQSAAQTAWGYLLGALVGEDVVTFGTVLSGRVTENSDKVTFPMITTVPTVIDCRAAHRETVRKLMKFNADVQENQFVPLNKIQHHMGYAGETLFDTIFTFQKRALLEYNNRTEFEFEDNELAIEYPVSVELEPTDSGELLFTLFYKPNYMQSDQASHLVDQFHFLLTHIIFQNKSVLCPQIQDADPKMFSIDPAKQESLASEYSLLHHTMEMNVQKNSSKIALEFITNLDGPEHGKCCWTFEDLDKEGNKIAHLIRKRNVAQGNIVAICFDKCPEAAFAMLGILKAGCAFLALDTGAPVDRKRFIMDDSEAALLLTKGQVAEALVSLLPNITVDLGAENMQQYPSTAVQLDRNIDPQEMAYCLYTSGTTGTPKGCVVTHENVVQVLLCFEKLYAYTDSSKWLQFASYHFDVSVMEHFWSWFVGMTVVKASRDLVLQDLSHVISTLQITHIDLTPSLARLLDPKDVPTLANGVFVTGGEMLRRDIIEAWGASGAIHNAYGPTEATIGVTMYRHVPKNGRSSNIGWPFDVVGVFVVQPNDPHTPVLRGGVGELLVTGKLVAKGYLRRDELTAERFIEVAGQRCYRTGDLARILSDGSIEFLGRADDQVKLRGQRLETGEINSVIKQQRESIDDVSTLVLKHPRQQKEQLVSFVAMRGMGRENDSISICRTDGTAELISEIRAACKSKLPGYMIPTHVLLVNKLPLSPNNKVDVKRLKVLYESTGMDVIQSLVESQQPDNLDAVQQQDIQQITKVLSQSLGLGNTEIPSSSSFFELGLDSISVISFSRSLKDAGYEKANSALVMKNSTVSALAQALTQGKSQAKDEPIQSATKRISAFNHRYKSLAASLLNVSYEDIEAVMPCTALQAGMISRSLESNQGLYFAAFSFQLKETVIQEEFRNACERVCNNVQMLRTRFVPTDDGYVQAVVREIEVPWTECKVESEQKLQGMLKKSYQNWWRQNSQEIRRPLELLLVNTPTKRIFTLHIFHALYDGNSLPLIMDAVIAEYNGDSSVSYGPPFLDALPYGPLVEVKGAQKFWTEQLSRLVNSSNSELRPLSNDHEQHDTCVTHRIEPIDGLENCRRKLNVTLQAMMQACWSVLLQDVMSQPLVIGIIVSGRSIEFEGADKVIGPMFNTIPFILTWNELDTWKSVITKSHNFNIAALPYQHTPLRDVQKWTRKQRTLGTLFETLFVFQKEHRRDSDFEPLWTAVGETFEADYPIAFEVEQALDGGLNLTLACQAHVSNKEASAALLQRFENTLLSLVDSIDVSISTVTDNRIKFQQTQHKSTQNGHANGNHTDSSKQTNRNGTINGHQNGTSEVSSTETVEIVCKEIAALADTSIGEIHRNTSIFEIGLDSIDAVKLSSRLKKVTGIQTPVSQIMQLLTSDKIAAAIDSRRSSGHQEHTNFDLEAVSEAIEKSLRDARVNLTGVDKILPCTPLQEGMIADMLNSDFERYLNFDILELESDIDVDRFKAAWTAVVEAFPILRSRFIEVSDPELDCTIAQAVVSSNDLVFGDMVNPVKDDFSQIYSRIRTNVKHTFGDQPAMRLTFVRNNKNIKPAYLVLTLAHAMYDGWSLGLIHNCVSKAYHGESFEHSSYEPALSKILSSSGQSSLRFWRNQVADTKPTLFPSNNKGNGVVYRLQRNSQTRIADVQKFCKLQRVTVAALCQTVWSIVLAHYTKQLDISFAQVLSGRTDETTNDVIFPTMNTVMSRTVLHGNRAEIVRYVQENLTEMSQHQHFPLRKALSMASGRSAKEIFNTLFIFQKASSEPTADRRHLYKSVDSASNVEYPVCVEAEVDNCQLIWRTACEDSYLNQSETKTFLEKLDIVLEAMISNPDHPVVEVLNNETILCNLPAIDTAQEQDSDLEPHSDDSYVSDEPDDWSDEEQLVREVVADVAKLEMREVKKHLSIFGLGLDSISTIKVSSLLRKHDFKISVNDILSADSIQQIAARGKVVDANSLSAPKKNHSLPLHGGVQNSKIHRNLPGDIDTAQLLAANQIKESNVERILPTTAGQILFLSRWQNEGVYYSSLDFSVRGCNDINELKSTWADLVQRTPMLRTVFIATAETKHPVLQITLKSVIPAFVSVGADSSLDQAANNRDSTSSSLQCPCTLFAQESGKNKFQLALKISHALYDGFSLKMFISTFEQLLKDRSSIHTTSDQSTFSNFFNNTGSSVSKRQFWAQYLADMTFVSLPLSKDDESDAKPKHNHLVRANVLSQISALKEFARKNQISVQSLLIASYSISHANMIKNGSEDGIVEDVLIGIFMANRNVEGADELEAPTLGFAPVRVRKPLGRKLVEIAESIQADLREIAEDGRGQVGLWELQEWLGDHIKIDVWINILRQWLPDQSGNDENQVQVVTGEKSENIREQFDITRSDQDISNGLFLQDNAVRSCYDYPMMDLEATVKDDNMDIGIQAPSTLFGFDGMECIIQEVASRLEELTE